MKKIFTLLFLSIAFIQLLQAQAPEPIVNFEIDSWRAHASGLRFTRFNSTSPSTPGAKTLGVDAQGNVVAVDGIADLAQRWAGSNNLDGNIYRNGNVGIGTTNPIYNLEVQGKERSVIRVGAPYNSPSAIGDLRFQVQDLKMVNGINEWDISFRTDTWASGKVGDFVIYSRDNTDKYSTPFIAQANGNVLLVSGSNSVKNGNVGIGTTNPTAKLEINSEVANTSGLKFSNLTSISPANPSAMPIGVDNQGNVVVINGGGANVSWNITGNSGTNSNMHFLGTLDAQDLIIKTSNQERLRITKDGVVGIGGFTTSLPTVIDENNPFRLYVKNGIRTERLKVDISADNKWADFVFEENYKLRTLEELDLFIQTNKHLPNIPTAQQVLTQGLDVAEINARLLEKVEELTLYTIDLNKQDQDQNKLVDFLLKKLEEVSRHNTDINTKNKEQEKLIHSLSERLEKLENQEKK